MKQLNAWLVVLVAFAASVGISAEAPPDPALRSAGMSGAPPILKALDIQCRLVNARYIKPYIQPGSSAREKVGNQVMDVLTTGATQSVYAVPEEYDWVLSERYEVACDGGLGYVLVAGNVKTGVQSARKSQAYLCAEAAQMSTGKSVKVGIDAILANALAEQRCVLSENAEAAQREALAALALRGGASCDIQQMRAAGRAGSNSYIDLACADGTGVLLALAFPVKSDSTVQAAPCFAVPESSGVQCQLVPRAQSIAAVDALMARSGADCKVANRRLVGAMRNGDSLYEYACEGGQGYILRTNTRGEIIGGVDCGDAEAKPLGGCKLSPAAGK
ncbi:MAG: hypothetical protein U1F30_07195 [Steroidobacteraceae bacterium]